MRFNQQLRYKFNIQNSTESERLQNILFNQGIRWQYQNNRTTITPRQLNEPILIVLGPFLYIGSTSPIPRDTIDIDVPNFIRYFRLSALLSQENNRQIRNTNEI